MGNDDNGACAARAHNELIAELLDCRIPKNEREHAAAREIERLQDDKRRLDWLADPANAVGNVQLPRACVETNAHSLRAAIDDAMKLPAPSNKHYPSEMTDTTGG